MLEEDEGGGVSGASLASNEWYESFSVASILVCVDMGGNSSPATVDLEREELMNGSHLKWGSI